MKKNYLCIIMTMILATTLMLGGCSSGKKAETKGVTNDNKSVAATLTPEPTAEANKIPIASDWTVVADFKVSHPTNICGFLNDKRGITVGYSGEIHYTEDGGKTWPRAKNSSMCRFSLDIVNENLAWCGGNGGNVRVSKDGGKTWKAVSDIVLGGMHSGIDFVDDKTGWIMTNAKLASTTDGGKTWKELTTPSESTGNAAVCLRTTEDGYLLSLNGLFFTTNDGGTTWKKHDFNFAQYEITNIKGKPELNKGNIALADLTFTDEKNGIMVFTGIKAGEGSRTLCLTTTDGGDTWISELLPKFDGFLPAKVCLSSDGTYLTLATSNNQTKVFRHDK